MADLRYLDSQEVLLILEKSLTEVPSREGVMKTHECLWRNDVSSVEDQRPMSHIHMTKCHTVYRVAKTHRMPYVASHF